MSSHLTQGIWTATLPSRNLPTQPDLTTYTDKGKSWLPESPSSLWQRLPLTSQLKHHISETSPAPESKTPSAH